MVAGVIFFALGMVFSAALLLAVYEKISLPKLAMLSIFLFFSLNAALASLIWLLGLQISLFTLSMAYLALCGALFALARARRLRIASVGFDALSSVVALAIFSWFFVFYLWPSLPSLMPVSHNYFSDIPAHYAYSLHTLENNGLVEGYYFSFALNAAIASWSSGLALIDLFYPFACALVALGITAIFLIACEYYHDAGGRIGALGSGLAAAFFLGISVYPYDFLASGFYSAILGAISVLAFCWVAFDSSKLTGGKAILLSLLTLGVIFSYTTFSVVPIVGMTLLSAMKIVESRRKEAAMAVLSMFASAVASAPFLYNLFVVVDPAHSLASINGEGGVLVLVLSGASWGQYSMTALILLSVLSTAFLLSRPGKKPLPILLLAFSIAAFTAAAFLMLKLGFSSQYRFFKSFYLLVFGLSAISGFGLISGVSVALAKARTGKWLSARGLASAGFGILLLSLSAAIAIESAAPSPGGAGIRNHMGNPLSITREEFMLAEWVRANVPENRTIEVAGSNSLAAWFMVVSKHLPADRRQMFPAGNLMLTYDAWKNGAKYGGMLAFFKPRSGINAMYTYGNPDPPGFPGSTIIYSTANTKLLEYSGASVYLGASRTRPNEMPFVASPAGARPAAVSVGPGDFQGMTTHIDGWGAGGASLLSSPSARAGERVNASFSVPSTKKYYLVVETQKLKFSDDAFNVSVDGQNFTVRIPREPGLSADAAPAEMQLGTVTLESGAQHRVSLTAIPGNWAYFNRLLVTSQNTAHPGIGTTWYADEGIMRGKPERLQGDGNAYYVWADNSTLCVRWASAVDYNFSGRIYSFDGNSIGYVPINVSGCMSSENGSVMFSCENNRNADSGFDLPEYTSSLILEFG